jgi:hypothetical protein
MESHSDKRPGGLTVTELVNPSRAEAQIVAEALDQEADGPPLPALSSFPKVMRRKWTRW